MKPKVMAMQMMDEEMPCMSLSSYDLKEIKDWKTGGKYTLQVKVTMKETELDDDDKVCAEFIIDEVKVIK
jgi:hypothetical protein